MAAALLFFTGYAWNWLTTGEAHPHAAEDWPPVEDLRPLLTFVALLRTGIAWRWEGLGGAFTVVYRLATLPLLLVHQPITDSLPRYIIAGYGI